MTKINRSTHSQECHNKHFKQLNRSYFKKNTSEQWMFLLVINKQTI
jgi:hypothetical protein